MYPVLLEHPYLGSYRVFLLLAFFFGYLLARYRAKKSGLDPRHIDNIALLVAITGIAGGRLFSRLFYYPTPLTFWEALKIWKDGGLVFYGGVIFGIFTVLIYAAVRKVRLIHLFDVLAPSLALGLGFGRVGCFLVGCCWGDVCVDPHSLHSLGAGVRDQIQTISVISSAHFPFAVQFPSTAGAFEQHVALGLIDPHAARSLPVHPVQIYEALLAFLLCAFLNHVWKRGYVEGTPFILFCVSYGLIRFSMEIIRADSESAYLGGLTISQCISLSFILVGVSCYYLRRLMRSADHALAPV